MRKSIKTGIGFGVTSGVITVLGSMIGLYSGTLSQLVTLGGILTIAIADAFSDSLGIHVSKEFERDSTTREVWEATLTTFLTKFFVGLSFIFPVIFFSLKIAVIVSICWGMLLLGVFSFFIARAKKVNPCYVIFEHVFIAIVVIFLAGFIGSWIRKIFI